MTKKMIEVTEDDMHAYVDQQLSDEKVKVVEDLMQKNPQVAQKIHQWQDQNRAIKTLFDEKKPQKIPQQLNLKRLSEKTYKGKTQHQNTPWYYSMAASLFLMVTSGITGWYAHDFSQPMTANTTNFVNSAISAHQVFTVEVLHPVEINADHQTDLVAWLSKRINHSLKVPDLNDYGYSLLGGRLLSMRKGRPAAQLMFENTEGKRVTLLMSKNPSYRDQSFHFKSDNNVNAYYWMDDNVAYSIASKMDSAALRKLSKSVYQQLNGKQPRQVANLY